MSKYHKNLLDQIKKNSPKKADVWVGQTYLGSPHKFYGLKTDIKRRIAKDFYKQNYTLSSKDFFGVVDVLYKAESFEEKTLASEIILMAKDYQNLVTLSMIDSWLDNLVGWAEIDNLCQSKILIPFIEKDFEKTAGFIHKLSKSSNISKRRASLVLLVKPASYLEDKKIFDLGIQIIEELKSEKQVLITKAISWLLRALSVHHKSETKAYIQRNMDTLPKIAIRETLKKIETGKK